jgi:hypothetical protein
VKDAIRRRRILGRAKVTGIMTISVIAQVRPFLDVKPGDYVFYVRLENGTIAVERAGTWKTKPKPRVIAYKNAQGEVGTLELPAE